MSDAELDRLAALGGAARLQLGREVLGGAIAELVDEVRRLRGARYAVEQAMGDYRQRFEAPTAEEAVRLRELACPPRAVTPPDADAPTVVGG